MIRKLTLKFETGFRRSAGRRGFSLLELILALGLTVIVVSAITTAIRLYMFQLQQRQKEIEQKQISRGVIRMVSDDVRASLQYKAEDNSALENLVASQSLSGLGGGLAEVEEEDLDADELEQTILDAVAANGGAGGDGEVQQDGAATREGTEGEADDESEEEKEEVGRPTLIGNNHFLRTDVSRLLRLHEYNPLVARRQSEDRLTSDVKTVTYFFSNSKPFATDDFQDESFGQQGGLYRRQIDRAVESFQSGDEDIDVVLQPDEYSELVSPEIAAIQFRYWNGEEWLAEWNSEQEGGFPSAIEIEIVIDPERSIQQVSADGQRQLEVETIRSVIHIPVAEIIPEEDESEDEEPQ